MDGVSTERLGMFILKNEGVVETLEKAAVAFDQTKQIKWWLPQSNNLYLWFLMDIKPIKTDKDYKKVL